MFKRATKMQRKARIAMYGPSGSGKTFTALRVARGLVGPQGTIGLIDTENDAASIYADRFAFDTVSIANPTVDRMIGAIDAAADYGCLIIDSSSHCWKELVGEVEKIARAKYNGNTWAAWSDGTPKQQAFIKKLIGFPGHLICTMRAKTEWQTEAADSNGSGKKKPVRVGLAPEQGKGIEYEFDLLIAITEAHIALVEKDRTGKWQDQAIEKPGEDFGRDLAEWLAQGEAPPPPPVADEAMLSVLKTAVAGARDTAAVRNAFDRLCNEQPNEPTMAAAKVICRSRHDQLIEGERLHREAQEAKRNPPPVDDDYAPADDGPAFVPDDEPHGAPVNSRRRQSAAK